jgi:hypothetical protein
MMTEKGIENILEKYFDNENVKETNACRGLIPTRYI